MTKHVIETSVLLCILLHMCVIDMWRKWHASLWLLHVKLHTFCSVVITASTRRVFHMTSVRPVQSCYLSLSMLFDASHQHDILIRHVCTPCLNKKRVKLFLL